MSTGVTGTVTPETTFERSSASDRRSPPLILKLFTLNVSEIRKLSVAKNVIAKSNIPFGRFAFPTVVIMSELTLLFDESVPVPFWKNV